VRSRSAQNARTIIRLVGASGAARVNDAIHDYGAPIESSLLVKQFLGLLSMWIACRGALAAGSLS
jgi:hypothetical protein